MVRKLVIAIAASACVLVTLPALASAGQWVQVSCENPNGTTASNDGWTSSTFPASPNGFAGAQCAKHAPMEAYLEPGTNLMAFSDVSLNYAPPAGSSLVGGSLAISGFAGGFGDSAAIGAFVYTPQAGDTVYRCLEGSQDPCAAHAYNFSTTVQLPSHQSGGLHLQVQCTGSSTSACDQGFLPGNVAGDLFVHSAHLLLSNSATPTLTHLRGSVLRANVRGRTRLGFTAADPGGPGVYSLTARIGNRVIFSGTPNREDGACVAVGKDTSSGALEFDYGHPCPAAIHANFPVDTPKLADGSHRLTITVTDAAGNRTTLVRSVSTANS